ncbi:MAG: DinB family protein, partial [Acidobacteria bacterium]|nr:DinB family protein [Acidobacteriota bacterium]
MSETSEDYKTRLIGYVGDREPVEILGETARLVRNLLDGVDPKDFAIPPAPGKWSIAEILAHLADDEFILAYRMRTVLVDPGVEIVSFDQNRWADDLRYREIPPGVSLAAFETARQWNLELMKTLTPEQWDRFGVHEERGRESIRDMALLYAGHD